MKRSLEVAPVELKNLVNHPDLDLIVTWNSRGHKNRLGPLQIIESHGRMHWSQIKPWEQPLEHTGSKDCLEISYDQREFISPENHLCPRPRLNG